MNAFDSTSAPAAQAEKRAHPTIVDKHLWMEKLLADKSLTQSAKIIGVRLSLHHNSQTGKCYPPVEDLMEGTNNSRATVHRALQALKKAGYIDWKSGNSKWANSYSLRNVPTKQPTERPASKVSHLRLATSQGVPVSKTEGPTVSPVRPLTISPVRPQPMKTFPSGRSEGREKEEENQASDSPASPLCLDGDGSSRTGEDERQPDKQPEAETNATDGMSTFHQISQEWKVQAREWAEVQFLGDQTFINQASKGFKAVAIEKGWKLTEDKWHEVWKLYSMSEGRKRPTVPGSKSKSAI